MIVEKNQRDTSIEEPKPLQDTQLRAIGDEYFDKLQIIVDSKRVTKRVGKDIQ